MSIRDELEVAIEVADVAGVGNVSTRRLRAILAKYPAQVVTAEDEFALVPGFEVLHFIEVIIEELGPRAKLICHAAKGAPCRMRPADPDVDEWSDDYDGEMIDNDCFAVEWLEAADWEGISVMPYDKPVATIPVSVGYDGDSAVLTVLHPHPTTP